MLVKFLPEQIGKHWDIIEYSIRESVPPTAGESPESMNNILMALLDGRMDCWISVGSESQRFECVCITQVLEEDATKIKSLLLYSIYGFNDIDENSWFEAFSTVSKYGKSLGCTKIILYTDVEYVIEKAREFNGDIRYFVSFDI